MQPLLLVLAVVTAATAAALLLPSRPAPPALSSLPVLSPGAHGLSRGDALPAHGSDAGGDGPWLRLVAAMAVALGAAVLVGGWPGPVAGVLGAATCWWVTGRMEPPAVRRRRERLVAAVPHAVDLMAACLGVGLSPTAAVQQVHEVVEQPLAEELATVCARLRLGVDPVTVWRELAGHPQLGGLGRTVARAAESGASVADAMQRLAEDLRRRRRAEVETRARAVGVKAAVPLGVCLLPAFVLVGVVPLVAGSLRVVLP